MSSRTPGRIINVSFQSAGKLSGFVFVGTGISFGALAGGQVGFYYAGPNDFGLYLEGHRRFVAVGSGGGLTPCPQ